MLHADPGVPLSVGSQVTIGHNATLHGCTVEDLVLIGMGAIVLNGARVGRHSIIAAGTVLAEGQQVPEGVLGGCRARSGVRCPKRSAQRLSATPPRTSGYPGCIAEANREMRSSKTRNRSRGGARAAARIRRPAALIAQRLPPPEDQPGSGNRYAARGAAQLFRGFRLRRVVLLGCCRAGCPAALSRSALGRCSSASASSARAGSAASCPACPARDPASAARACAPAAASSRSCRAAATCSRAACSAWAARACAASRAVRLLLGGGLRLPRLGQPRLSLRRRSTRLPRISLGPLAAPPEREPRPARVPRVGRPAALPGHLAPPERGQRQMRLPGHRVRQPAVPRSAAPGRGSFSQPG